MPPSYFWQLIFRTAQRDKMHDDENLFSGSVAADDRNLQDSHCRNRRFSQQLDALFFTALRAARESDTLRQFDCFKEAERYLLRIAASSYLSGLTAGMAVGGKNCDAEKSSDAPARREKDGSCFSVSFSVIFL